MPKRGVMNESDGYDIDLMIDNANRLYRAIHSTNFYRTERERERERNLITGFDIILILSSCDVGGNHLGCHLR